jgi:hypothetical protein
VGSECQRLSLVESYIGATCKVAIVTQSSSFGNLAVALGDMRPYVMNYQGFCKQRDHVDPRDFLNGQGKNVLEIAKFK